MPKTKQPDNSISVEGIVSRRDKQPYVNLFKGKDPIGQMTIAQARKIAMDILQMAARTEADAMIYKFFSSNGLGEASAGQLMLDFRVFRHQLDNEPVEGFISTPSGDPPVQ